MIDERSVDYVQMLRSWWWLVLLVPLLSAGDAYWLTQQRPTSSTATAVLLVTPASSSSTDIGAARMLAISYAELISSRPVLEEVIASLQLNRAVNELTGQISASVVPDTQVIRVSVTDSDPRLAADLANRTSEAFVRWIAEQQSTASANASEMLADRQAVVSESIDGVTGQIAELRSEGEQVESAEQVILTRLQATLAQLQDQQVSLLETQQRTALTAAARVVVTTTADVPTVNRFGPMVRNATVAGLLTLILTCTAIVLMERFNGWIRSARDLEQATSLPVLGVLPASAARGLIMVQAPDSPTSESFRSLRVNLQLTLPQPKVMLLTSPQRSDHVAWVAANLAVVFAEVGRRVVLIDGDLRRPHLSTIFGVEPGYGLETVLAQPNLTVASSLIDSPIPGLKLLLSTSGPNSPTTLLVPERLIPLVDALKSHADLIIITTPPALMVPDVLLMSAAVDQMLVVIDANRTKLQTLQMLMARLTPLSAPVLGTVLYGGVKARAFDLYRSTSRRKGLHPNAERTTISFNSDRGAD